MATRKSDRRRNREYKGEHIPGYRRDPWNRFWPTCSCGWQGKKPSIHPGNAEIRATDHKRELDKVRENRK